MTTPPPELGLRERKKRAAQRAIREAALALFSEHGFETVSVEQIAARAGVSKTTFFNYFATKEAVIADLNAEEAEHLVGLCEQRPDDEPLWQSLSAVVMQTLTQSRDAMVAQKRIKANSPALAKTFHGSGDRIVDALAGWAERRVRPEDRPLARLQLNVLVATVTTAFEEWSVDDPYEEFIELANVYLQQIGPAFA